MIQSEHRAGPSDPVLSTLYKAQIHFASFRQLTGSNDPRELTIDGIHRTRERMARADQIVRSKHQGKDTTCLAWPTGGFWLLLEGVGRYCEAVKKSCPMNNGYRVQPLWRLTLREMVNLHLANLRQLVLWVAYDSLTIDALKENISHGHALLRVEFTRRERSVANLIRELLLEQERLAKLLSEKVEIYEQARITERMIQTGEVTETALGYTLEELKQAQQRVQYLCRRDLAIYEQVLNLTRGRVGEGLRGGERMQLARTNHLGHALHERDGPPEGFVGLATLAAFERTRWAAVVAAREKELGPSDEGTALLAESVALEHAREEAAAKPGEPYQPAKKKPAYRMASAERREKP